MLRRIGIALSAVAASLTLAAAAQAAPTTPIMKPIPYYNCETPVLSWTPSTPDPGGIIVSYRVDLSNLTAGTSGMKWVPGLSVSLGGLPANQSFVARVRALQFHNGITSYSASSGRAFSTTCLRISKEILDRYVAYNPFPECIMCGKLEDIYTGVDPEISKQLSVATLPGADRLKGIEIAGDGSVRFIGA
jgi:hypothetical protein